jgi:hypothetical protein
MTHNTAFFFHQFWRMTTVKHWSYENTAVSKGFHMTLPLICLLTGLLTGFSVQVSAEICRVWHGRLRQQRC